MGTTTPAGGDPAASEPPGDPAAGPPVQGSDTSTTGAAGDLPAAPVRARGRAVGVLVGVAAVVLAGDAVAKYFVVRDLTDHPPVRALGGLIYLDLFRNSGAAFSMLSNQTWLFTVVATLALVWIAVLAKLLRSYAWAVALGLVAGGALGNLADRVFRAPGFLVGHVVDYISLFGPNGEHFAIFNLADSMLCVGVALAVLLELTGFRRDGTRAGRRADRAA
ncbi:MAG TPA: signal peptidase II [Rugosimonospora sp.]|nr:signal peptidase II [Rugosimonospora sp.]